MYRNKIGLEKLNKILTKLKTIHRPSTLETASLMWGSHRKEFGISEYILETWKQSSGYPEEIEDPVINDLVHKYYFQDQYIWKIRNSIVDNYNSVAWVGQVALKESKTFSSITSNPKNNLRKSLAIQPGKFGMLRATSYFHWLLEEIPRALAIIQTEPEAVFFIGGPKNKYPFIAETLDYFNIKHIFSDLLVKPEELLLTNAPKSGWVRKTDIELLEKIVSKKTISLKSTHEKIYLSRSNSSRSISNEQDIENHLIRKGFNIVYLEQLDFSHQVAMLQNSSLVVAPHGAGLSNLIFGSHNLKIVELMDESYANNCFALLAKYRNQSYSKILMESSNGIPEFNSNNFHELDKLIRDNSTSLNT